MKFIKTNEKVRVDNYPYGYKKTTAFFSIEHKAGKGFRKVFQTINPKTGVLNKEKKSTYTPIKVLAKNEDGKVVSVGLDFYGDEGMQKAITFMSENFELFTKEEIKSVAITTLTFIRADINAKVVYCNADLKKICSLYESPIKKITEIANSGDNLFSEIKIDFKAIEALEEKGYQPFKVTSRSINYER